LPLPFGLIVFCNGVSLSVGADEDLTDGTDGTDGTDDPDDTVGLAFVPVLKSPRKIERDIFLYFILIKHKGKYNIWKTQYLCCRLPFDYLPNNRIFL
jgi:hypothetical protein